MSGYIGNPDAEQEHALILAENGVESSRTLLRGSVRVNCKDCGNPIPELRRQAAMALSHKCDRCITCQQKFELRPQPKIRMLDRIL